MPETLLELQNLYKRFGNMDILKKISLTVHKGEFLTLLGPSGCGKTTTLRSIAGLEKIDGGSILLNGTEISGHDPDQRNVNTVFQNYALFPHMNVYDNISYALRIRRTDKQTIRKKTAEMLSLVQMEGYEKRKPDQLSGGQRQRIAIARALINNPDLLLLDEPLGALDLKLRHHMQTELKRLQKQTGTTFIYVTHDQEEALNMSDRLVIMNEGKIEQIGTPEDIYNHPQTRFAAEFVGDRNIMNAVVLSVHNGYALAACCGQQIKVADESRLSPGEKITLAVHTNKIRITCSRPSEFSLEGKIYDTHYTGSQNSIQLHILSKETISEIPFKVVEYENHSHHCENDTVFVSWDPEDGVVIKEAPHA